MRRNHIVGLLGIVAGAFAASGCGATAQYAYGFSDEIERTTTRTRQVRIEAPVDAVVDRRNAEGFERLVKSTRDEQTYEVKEVVHVPTSRVPMYLGTAFDALGVGASLLVLTKVDDKEIPAYCVYTFGMGLIADLIFSIVYSIDQTEEVVRYEPTQTKPVTYIARLGEEVRQGTIDVSTTDFVRLDFAEPDPAHEPGAPKNVILPPPSPTEHEPVQRGEPIETRWYGWQTLLPDLAATAMMLTGLSRKDYVMAGIGSGIYGVVPPLIHLANGEPANAGASVGLRLTFPLGFAAGGGLVGLFVAGLVELFVPGVDSFEFITKGLFVGAASGLFIGAPLVVVLDAAAIGHKPVQPEEPTMTIIPSAGRTDDGHATFGIAGRF